MTANLVPHAYETLQLAQCGYAFQYRDVLRMIVETEQKRIKNERLAWRIGGAVVGALFGIGDGFDLSDIAGAMVVSNISGLAHEFASKEQMEFLERCKSSWLVSNGSPLEAVFKDLWIWFGSVDCP